VPPNRKVLEGNGGKKAFGEEVFPFWIMLVRIFLFDMNLKDTILAVNRSQFEIFQDKLRQQELNNGQEAFQNDAV